MALARVGGRPARGVPEDLGEHQRCGVVGVESMGVCHLVQGDQMTEYKCSTCKQLKAEVDFYADKRTTNGRKSQCKKCHAACSS